MKERNELVPIFEAYIGYFIEYNENGVMDYKVFEPNLRKNYLVLTYTAMR